MKQITACAFGWYERKKGLGQHVLNQCFRRFSFGAPSTIGVICLTQVLLAPQIEQNIARAAVKTRNTLIWVQDAEVGHASDIEYDVCFCRAAPQ